MTRKLLTLCALGLTFGAFPAVAQVPNMRAVNAAIGQHHMNMQMNMQRQMTMMNLGMARRSTELYNPKAKYTVLLKDSTKLEVKSKILFDENNISYLLAENKKLKKEDLKRVQRIYPADTYSIRKIDVDGTISTPGVPADSCWLFQVVKGKINGYSFLPATNLHSGYFKFVQKGNGEMLKPDMEVLKSMVSDNKKAMMLAYDARFYEAMMEYNRARPVKK